MAKNGLPFGVNAMMKGLGINPKDVNKMLESGQKLQEGKKIIDETVFEGSAQNGAVVIKIKGNYEIQSVYISPEIAKELADDAETLSEIVQAAFTIATENILEAQSKLMNENEIAGIGNVKDLLDGKGSSNPFK